MLRLPVIQKLETSQQMGGENLQTNAEKYTL